MLKSMITYAKNRLALATTGGAVTLFTSLILVAPIVPRSAIASDIAPASAQAENGNFFRISLNKSAVVTLPAEAKEVIVGNTDIVDVQVRNKNTAYLFARKTGSTNIFFFDAKGNKAVSYTHLTLPTKRIV